MSQDLLNKKREGLSLTEIIIAVAFFGIITVALALPVSNSLFVTYDNESISTANVLARSYLKELQDSWQLQSAYDNGILIPVDDVYTANGKYTVTVSTTDLQANPAGTAVILRRVTVTYQDSSNNTTLCEVYFDYNRP